MESFRSLSRAVPRYNVPSEQAQPEERVLKKGWGRVKGFAKSIGKKCMSAITPKNKQTNIQQERGRNGFPSLSEKKVNAMRVHINWDEAPVNENASRTANSFINDSEGRAVLKRTQRELQIDGQTEMVPVETLRVRLKNMA